MSNQEKCPVCGSNEYEHIEISGGGEYPSGMIINRKGSVDIVCCTNCGVIRVSKRSLDFRLGRNKNNTEVK